MRKFILGGAILLLAVSLPGCRGCSTRNTVGDRVEAERVQMENELHNAPDPRAYEGVYVTETAADAARTVVHIITLGNNMYERVVEMPEPKRSERGRITWNDTGDIITLEGAAKPNMYYVRENRIIMLDDDGETYPGPHSLLVKQN